MIRENHLLKLNHLAPTLSKGLKALALCLILHFSGVVQPLDRYLEDRATVLTPPSTTDDGNMILVGPHPQRQEPLPAVQLLDRLIAAQPAQIVWLRGPRDPIFYKQIPKESPFLLGVSLLQSQGRMTRGEPVQEGSEQVPRALVPVPLNGELYPNQARTTETPWDALPLATAKRAGIKAGSKPFKLGPLWRNAPIPSVTYNDILEGRLPASLFKDRIVMVDGADFQTPQSSHIQLPGGSLDFLSYQGYATHALITHSHVKTLPAPLFWTLLAACLAVLSLCFSWLYIRAVVRLTLYTALAAFPAGWLAFHYLDLWLSPALFLTGLAGLFCLELYGRYMAMVRQLRHFQLDFQETVRRQLGAIPGERTGGVGHVDHSPFHRLRDLTEALEVHIQGLKHKETPHIEPAQVQPLAVVGRRS